MLLWYPGQNKGEQPSVCVTASTGKAASNQWFRHPLSFEPSK